MMIMIIIIIYLRELRSSHLIRSVRFWSWRAPGEPLTPLQVISLELPPPASSKGINCYGKVVFITYQLSYQRGEGSLLAGLASSSLVLGRHPEDVIRDQSEEEQLTC